ncbi:hypothetical protein B566_EDAN006861 [Ephemera danica]|nr:hypothetical protein B566_EDAN006861 [Ephemera danica]
MRIISDASSSNEAVHLQQRLRSLSTELVTLRNRLHVQAQPPGAQPPTSTTAPALPPANPTAPGGGPPRRAPSPTAVITSPPNTTATTTSTNNSSRHRGQLPPPPETTATKVRSPLSQLERLATQQQQQHQPHIQQPPVQPPPPPPHLTPTSPSGGQTGCGQVGSLPAPHMAGAATAGNLEDLIHLPGPLTEDAVLRALQARFAATQYFVSI